jgi:hypothetical protein
MNGKQNLLHIVAVALGLVSAAAHAEGKFCVVTNYGQNCYYYDANQCRAAAYQQGGMCVLNPDQQVAPQTSISTIMDNISRAGEEGRRRGMEQREFEARMALLKAQTEAMQQATAQQQAMTQQPMTEAQVRQPVGTPLYRCANEDGSLFYTATPVAGCVFLGNGN